MARGSKRTQNGPVPKFTEHLSFQATPAMAEAIKDFAAKASAAAGKRVVDSEVLRRWLAAGAKRDGYELT